MSRIRLRVGGFEVEYEGSDAFMEKKLPDLTEKLSRLAEQAPEGSGDDDDQEEVKRKKQAVDPGTLAAFLKKPEIRSKTARFLATAEWLHLSGKKLLTTGDVTTALSDNHQASVGNASQCLANNAKKGYCEKKGKEFFVTPEGRESLG